MHISKTSLTKEVRGIGKTKLTYLFSSLHRFFKLGQQKPASTHDSLGIQPVKKDMFCYMVSGLAKLTAQFLRLYSVRFISSGTAEFQGLIFFSRI